MNTQSLSPHEVMVEAFISQDVGFEGIFFTAVRTTGIFCHPTCGAKKPLIENTEFFATVGAALSAGYRGGLWRKRRLLDLEGAQLGI